MVKPRARRTKRVLLALAGVVFVVALALAAVGVPAPPSATVSGVPRLPWRSVLLAIPVARRMLGGARLVAWDPAGGLFVTGYDGTEPRLHRVEEPGAPAKPTELPPRAGGFSPSPDPTRRHAVFTLDEGGNESRRLYRWDFETQTSTPLTEAGTKIWLGPWSRDGGRVAYAVEGATDGDRDLYVMDPLDPDSARLVYRGTGSWSVSDWSGDGHRLLVSEYRSVVESRPHVLDIDSGEIRPLVELEPPSRYFGLRFTNDPNVVFFLSNRGTEFTGLRRVNLVTGVVEDVTDPVGWDVNRIAASHERTRFAIGINEDGVTRWFLLDPDTGARSSLPVPDDLRVVRVQFHPQRAAVAVTVLDRAGVAGVGVLDLEEGSFERWTEPPRDDEPPLPEIRLIHYPTFDHDGGRPRRIPAFVFDPPTDAPTPAPVIVRIHGGPEGQSTGYPNAMYDALRRELGASVITPNVRGSTGYGKTYVGLDDGRRREDAVRDIGALLDWIDEQPDLDPDRVIVYGGSYGGYMVLASLVHYPERIRCGVDVVGISNFVSFLENTKPYRRQLRRNEYGDERDPDMRAFLESISPLSRADEIRADLLVIQGANDPRVPVSESRRIVERLRELGREVWYLEFDDEGHGLRMPLNLAYAAVVGHRFAQHCLEP